MTSFFDGLLSSLSRAFHGTKTGTSINQSPLCPKAEVTLSPGVRKSTTHRKYSSAKCIRNAKKLKRKLPDQPWSMEEPTPRKKAQKPSDNSRMNRLYPTLIQSRAPVEQILLHLPRIARYFCNFYEIDTVGKLCSMSIEQVSANFPMPDAVCVIIKALVRYESRLKQENAAGARRLLCSPIRKLQDETNTPPSTKSKVFSPPDSTTEWCLNSKLLRHLEKAIHYVEAFRAEQEQDPRMIKVIRRHCTTLKEMTQDME